MNDVKWMNLEPGVGVQPDRVGGAYDGIISGLTGDLPQKAAGDEGCCARDGRSLQTKTVALGFQLLRSCRQPRPLVAAFQHLPPFRFHRQLERALPSTY